MVVCNNPNDTTYNNLYMYRNGMSNTTNKITLKHKKSKFGETVHVYHMGRLVADFYATLPVSSTYLSSTIYVNTDKSEVIGMDTVDMQYTNGKMFFVRTHDKEVKA